MEPITWTIFLVEWATFIVGAALLWLIAYRPIKRILTERRERILKAQSDADRARREAERLQKELEKRVVKLEGEEKKRMTKAEAEARKLREGILAEAREHAQEVMKQGREQMKRERAGEAEKLRQEIARTSVAMARKVTGAMLKAADRKRLVKKVLGQLPARFEGKA